MLIGNGVLWEDQFTFNAEKIELSEEGKKDSKEEQKLRKLQESDHDDFKQHTYQARWGQGNLYHSLNVSSLCYLEIQTPPPEYLV